MTSSKTLHTVDDLLREKLIDVQDAPALELLSKQYAIAISPEMVELIHTAGDPIGRQYIPHPDERITRNEEMTDPIGDEALSPVPGIVHRYEDRVLLKPILACPVYCRFCFRREQVGPENGLLSEEQLQNALQWIQSHTEIREVILSGGEPLMLSPRRMKMIIDSLNAITHVTTIRIHSRLPFSAPNLLKDSLVDMLTTSKALWIVLHANHAAEFTENAFKAVQKLQQKAIPLLGQSVLLSGVNDRVDALEALFRAMVEWRIKPYYLHQLDRAPGTARFYVPIQTGQQLLAGLRGRVTGLAWPTYVLDIPGGYGKVPLGPEYYHSDHPDSIHDPYGKIHQLSLSEKG